MSTRSTIWFNEEGLHLYYELADDPTTVCLEVSRGPFLMIIELPPEMVKAIAALPSQSSNPA